MAGKALAISAWTAARMVSITASMERAAEEEDAPDSGDEPEALSADFSAIVQRAGRWTTEDTSWNGTN